MSFRRAIFCLLLANAVLWSGQAICNELDKARCVALLLQQPHFRPIEAGELFARLPELNVKENEDLSWAGLIEGEREVTDFLGLLGGRREQSRSSWSERLKLLPVWKKIVARSHIHGALFFFSFGIAHIPAYLHLKQHPNDIQGSFQAMGMCLVAVYALAEGIFAIDIITDWLLLLLQSSESPSPAGAKNWAARWQESLIEKRVAPRRLDWQGKLKHQSDKGSRGTELRSVRLEAGFNENGQPFLVLSLWKQKRECPPPSRDHDSKLGSNENLNRSPGNGALSRISRRRMKTRQNENAPEGKDSPEEVAVPLYFDDPQLEAFWNAGQTSDKEEELRALAVKFDWVKEARTAHRVISTLSSAKHMGDLRKKFSGNNLRKYAVGEYREHWGLQVSRLYRLIFRWDDSRKGWIIRGIRNYHGE